ncbi:MAG: hypothetical protein WBP85_01395 [Terracidiphilus sp.]
MIKRRLLLIPAWLVAQYVYNLFSGMSAGLALAAMTSIAELWYSAIVIAVIVLYANNYKLEYGNKKAETPKPTGKPAEPKP